MRTAVGVFPSVRTARQAIAGVRAEAPEAEIHVMAPRSLAHELRATPSDETEPPGTGPAIGGVIGGAAGAAAVAAFAPLTGALAVVAVVAGALVGVGTGLAAGEALETRLANGLPKDELFYYADAVRHGRIVVAVLDDRHDAIERAGRALNAAGAESLDAARDAWWIGLVDAEAAHYRGRGGDFASDEVRYRRGFEAALACEPANDTTDALNLYLAQHHPEYASDGAFRQGFERGLAYREQQRFELVLLRSPAADEVR